MVTANYTMSEADIKAGKTTPLTAGALGTAENAGTKNLNNYNTPITSSSMQEKGTIPLTTPADNSASLQSQTNQALNDIANQANIAEQTNLQDAKTGYSNLANIQTLLGGKSADTNKAYEEKGVNTLFNQLSDLNAQATGLRNEAQAIPIQIQNEFAGRGATNAGVAPIESARLRDNALKALSLGQQAAIASSNYDKAKNYADQIVNAKYDQLEADIKAKLTNLTALEKFDLTPSQEKAKTARENLLKAQEQQIADKRRNEKDISDIIITAASQNAPASLVERAKLAKDPATAASILGTYAGDYWGTKIKIAQYQKTLADISKTNAEARGTGGISGVIGTAPGKSVAQAYLDQFNSGALELGDIYSKIGSSKTAEKIKNEFAKLVSAQGGKRVFTMDDSQISSINEQIKNIDDLLKPRGANLESISGLFRGGIFRGITRETEDALAIAKNLVTNQTLQSLADAKAKGVTFGALSEAELNTVASAASRVAARIETDPETKEIKGFSGSESAFKEDLKTIKTNLQKSITKKTGLTPMAGTKSKVDEALKILNMPINDLGNYNYN